MSDCAALTDSWPSSSKSILQEQGCDPVVECLSDHCSDVFLSVCLYCVFVGLHVCLFALYSMDIQYFYLLPPTTTTTSRLPATYYRFFFCQQQCLYSRMSFAVCLHGLPQNRSVLRQKRTDATEQQQVMQHCGSATLPPNNSRLCNTARRSLPADSFDDILNEFLPSFLLRPSTPFIFEDS